VRKELLEKRKQERELQLKLEEEARQAALEKEKQRKISEVLIDQKCHYFTSDIMNAG